MQGSQGAGSAVHTEMLKHCCTHLGDRCSRLGRELAQVPP